MAFVGLILAFPVLICRANPQGTSVREAVLPVLATEAILIGGLSTAARERQRLLAEPRRARPPPAGRSRASPTPAPRLRRAPVGRS